VLSLFNNEFTGTIPESFGRLVFLDVLYLQGNELGGALPQGICDLGIGDVRSDCGGPNPKVLCDCCVQCAR